MNRTLWIWLLAGALAASLALHFVPADREPPEPGAIGQAIAGLGLSEGQLDQLQADCASCCLERVTLCNDLEAKQAELRTALAATTIDRNHCDALAEAIGTLHARCLRNAIDTMVRVRKVLDNDQQRTLEEWQEALRR